ncbi:MAG: response regulator [Phycisphaerales bacterium]|nr:response regulator [Phycisphaerales bacterium]
MTASKSLDIVPLTIYALDDDPDFREYLQGVLLADGHSARLTGDPKELFEACEQHGPDVILLDVKMGEHSGTAVLEEIRERWPRQCVIMVTGFPSLESMRETFRKDVFDYIPKPFAVDDLRKSLNQAVIELGLGQKPLDRLRATLGRQIRLARTEKGWTLRNLSEISGVSVSQLSSIERGTHLPSVESLTSIAEALNVAPSTWFAAAGF